MSNSCSDPSSNSQDDMPVCAGVCSLHDIACVCFVLQGQRYSRKAVRIKALCCKPPISDQNADQTSAWRAPKYATRVQIHLSTPELACCAVRISQAPTQQKTCKPSHLDHRRVLGRYHGALMIPWYLETNSQGCSACAHRVIS